MLWLPAASVDVEKVATPVELRVPEPMVAPLSSKFTVPVSAPAVLVAVAVKVSSVPKVAGLALELMVTDVPAALTVCG